MRPRAGLAASSAPPDGISPISWLFSRCSIASRGSPGPPRSGLMDSLWFCGFSPAGSFVTLDESPHNQEELVKKPRILLIQPTTIHLDGTPHKTRWRLIMGLMIPLMAGLTPDDYDVTPCDERLEELNFDEPWDLVGMTTTIGASLRAYQLADEYRKRGVPVVMGGFHATLQTDEALKHADAVVQGEADLVWAGLLQDWRDGKLKQVYKSEKLHDLKNLPRPRHELLKLNKYLFKAVPVQASRGCPYRCSFCEIPVFYEGAYRTRPIEDIVEEIKQVVKITGFKRFQFIDDQITGKHKFARELFKALEPLNIRFSCLWTINSNHDDDLLDLAAKAGS